MSDRSVDEAISRYGVSLKDKFSRAGATGQPEDQLRGPLEELFRELHRTGSQQIHGLTLVGESNIAHLKTRPDYAVVLGKALVGFIELKAPGKGANPNQFTDPHDRDQWARLKSLPNLLYTDGNSFSLWRDGEIVGRVITLDGDVTSSGTRLAAPTGLQALIDDFLGWAPIPPRNAKVLADVAARLCRFLRDEVIEQIEQGNQGLADLAKDWRKLLFPEANNEQFADGYSQAVTFGLLVARARNIPLDEGIDHAATELRKSNSLIGTALRLLTDEDDNQKTLKTSLDTLTRVLNEVDWPTISQDRPEAWLYFYEDFLEVYDNDLRNKTGSYYTPPEVVDAMVRLVDEALCGPLFERPAGLAAADVTVADPAVGTGTYLLGVLRRIAARVRADQGPGAVRGAIEAAARRLIGFELQFGPFAVAQLRLIAEMQALMRTERDPHPVVPEFQLFITDTLGNPYVEEEGLMQVGAIAKSRRDANEIKKTKPITVVIGNPPYKEKAEGRGGWIEAGSDGRAAPMERWRPPVNWGVGTHTKHLKNLYVYFWRRATWKVFGAGFVESTGLPAGDGEGIVCFITVAGFLNGPGFQRMREDLRQTCSDIWVIDCSPEGHQPAVASRIFQGVQQPVCIVLAARKGETDRALPAHVRYRALRPATRQEKFTELATLSLDDGGWTNCSRQGRAAFLPAATGQWGSFPKLEELFIYNGSGVMPGRTWVIAPDTETLGLRWDRLVAERDPEKKEVLFHPHQNGDKTSTKRLQVGLTGHFFRTIPVAQDKEKVIKPTRYGFRSFDRQWIIPDGRLLNRPNPTIWNAHSRQQVYLTALEAHSPTSGPAVSLTGLIPDLHHYKGSFGGRAYPLWRDSEAREPNIRPGLMACLAENFGRAVGAAEMLAYIAAVMAHPEFTRRFAGDLVQPGLRLPVTADADLFAEAVALGQEIVWLHCYGERFIDREAGRPASPPRMPEGQRPQIGEGHGIPSDELPEEMDYDPATEQLIIGHGRVDNVSPEVWAYEVSGKQVLRQWFSYRRRDRSRPIIGDRRPPSPLDAMQPDGWPASYTSDLIDLLNVLGRLVALEAAQADLLERICSGDLLTGAHLREIGALPARAVE